MPIVGSWISGIWSINDAVAHHNQIISSEGNQVVLDGVRALLEGIDR